MVASRADPPLVTVVIPTYGRPGYLKDAIESISNQSYSNIELIVVDDHSPEPVRPQLQGISLDNFTTNQIIRHDENKGANAARRTGINAATGKYIAFLDDDDYWKEELLECVVGTFETNGGNTGVVMAGTSIVDEENRQIGTYIPQAEGRVTEQLLRGTVRGCSFSQFTVRRSVIAEAGLPDERLPSWQDWDWHIRLSKHCEYDSIQAPLVVRRYATHNQITDEYDRRRNISYRQMIQKHKPLASEFGDRCERRFVANLTQILGFSALRNGHYWEAIRQLLRSIKQDPTYWSTYLYLLLAIGGPLTYLPARHIKYRLAEQRSVVSQ